MGRPSYTLVEVLLNIKGYDEATRLLDEQIGTYPRYAYAYICRARMKAGQGAYDAAMSDLDTALSISTAKGGSGDNRVPLTRAMLVLQSYAQSGDSQQLTETERILREAMPSVPSGFRPRFRNLLIHVHWYRARWDTHIKMHVNRWQRTAMRSATFSTRHSLPWRCMNGTMPSAQQSEGWR